MDTEAAGPDETYNFGPTSPPKSGYPLSMLFLLMGVSGIVAGFVAPAVREWVSGKIPTMDVVMAAISGGIILGLIGAFTGLAHFRRGQGMLWGTLVGSLLGVLFGPIGLASQSGSFNQVIAAVVGSFVLVVAAICMQIRQRRQ